MSYSLIEQIPPSLESTYRDFSQYLDNPVMYKIKNVQGYSMYMAKTYCLMSNQCRYIVVLVGEDASEKGDSMMLEQMQWICLQTRTLDNQYSLPSHNYRPTKTGPLSAKIFRTHVTSSSTEYDCQDYPVHVSLLHTKTKTADDYQARGTLVAALETYETVVTFRDEHAIVK